MWLDFKFLAKSCTVCLLVDVDVAGRLGVV